MSGAVNPRSSDVEIDGTVLRGQLLDRRHRLRHAMADGGGAGLRGLLDEVDAALTRIDDGSFGLCDRCHDPIEVERLAVDPMTKVCLECLSDDEQKALEYDLELAAQVQQNLLSDRQLVTDGWEFYVHYQPAGPVSGDHFDLIRGGTDPSEVYFVLGDISGKGVSAAILGAHLQAIFRGLVAQDLTVPEVMERANRLFARATLANAYATLVFGRVQPSGLVELASAGHPPALLVSRDCVIPVEATGVPLGMFADSRFAVRKLQLAEEDRLFLYTDGLIEAQNEHEEEYGLDELSMRLAGGWGVSAEATVSASLGALEGFANGTPRTDDLTVLVIRRTGDSR